MVNTHRRVGNEEDIYELFQAADIQIPLAYLQNGIKLSEEEWFIGSWVEKELSECIAKLTDIVAGRGQDITLDELFSLISNASPQIQEKVKEEIAIFYCNTLTRTNIGKIHSVSEINSDVVFLSPIKGGQKVTFWATQKYEAEFEVIDYNPEPDYLYDFEDDFDDDFDDYFENDDYFD